MDTTTQDTQEENTATEETTTEKPTGSDQNKNARLFTQDELNKVVAKEKAAWKKSADKFATDHETIVEGLRSDITKRDELILSQVELLKKDLEIDEEDWQETMGDRDALAQYQYLMKRVEKAGKKDIPRTPKATTNENKIPAFTRTNIV